MNDKEELLKFKELKKNILPPVFTLANFVPMFETDSMGASRIALNSKYQTNEHTITSFYKPISRLVNPDEHV